MTNLISSNENSLGRTRIEVTNDVWITDFTHIFFSVSSEEQIFSASYFQDSTSKSKSMKYETSCSERFGMI